MKSIVRWSDVDFREARPQLRKSSPRAYGQEPSP